MAEVRILSPITGENGDGERIEHSWRALRCESPRSARCYIMRWGGQVTAASTISRLGRYQLLRVLGQGAMGVVYEGLDPSLGRQVAVKTILRSALLDADTVADTSARFIREAQAIARLSHPHIVMVFDFGEEGDVAYFVMEFIRGRDLKTALDAGESFAVADTVRIVCELLSALDFAHRHGVVHRDVKPANVMLDAAGHVKLTDFGVARVADSSGERTMAGTMVGTPSYMSPEQILGQPVGSRTDIFAVGIILYQCLTGTKPFVGPGAWATQKQIVHDDPTPPSAACAGIDPAFDAIVARALAKDPEVRYGSAAEFADALRAAASGTKEPISRPVTRLAAVPAAGDATVAATLVEGGMPHSANRAEASASGPEGNVAIANWSLSRRLPLIAMAIVGVGLLAVAAFWLRPAPVAPVTGVIHKPAVPEVAAVEKAPPAERPPPEPAPGSAPGAQTDRAAVSAAAPSPARKDGVPTGGEEVARAVSEKSRRTTVRDAPTKYGDVGLPSDKSGRARCSDLLQRFQIGDTLSSEELNALQKECRK